MRALPLIVFIAGCSQPSYSTFRADLTAAWCQRLVRCGKLAAGAACNALPDASGLGGDGHVDIPSSIAQHHMTFHPDNAHACLTTVTLAPCDDAQFAADVAVGCHGIVTGAVENGKRCAGDADCLGGSCNGAQCNAGVCTAYPAIGAPCATGCDPTQLFCDVTSGTCQLERMRGAACDRDEECLFSSVCVDGKCGDRPRGGGGVSCGATAPPCADGFYCAGGVCSLMNNRGDACTPGSCAPDSECIAGTCAAVESITLASRCASDGDCPAAQYCESGFCDWRRGAGGVCVADDQCASGLVCSGNACIYAGVCGPPAS